MARENLKKARKKLGLTQQALADRLYINLRYYQMIEQGSRIGSVEIWDQLEDLTAVHQRILRENEANHHDQGASR